MLWLGDRQGNLGRRRVAWPDDCDHVRQLLEGERLGENGDVVRPLTDRFAVRIAGDDQCGEAGKAFAGLSNQLASGGVWHSIIGNQEVPVDQIAIEQVQGLSAIGGTDDCAANTLKQSKCRGAYLLVIIDQQDAQGSSSLDQGPPEGGSGALRQLVRP